MVWTGCSHSRPHRIKDDRFHTDDAILSCAGHCLVSTNKEPRSTAGHEVTHVWSQAVTRGNLQTQKCFHTVLAAGLLQDTGVELGVSLNSRNH